MTDITDNNRLPESPLVDFIELKGIEFAEDHTIGHWGYNIRLLKTKFEVDHLSGGWIVWNKIGESVQFLVLRDIGGYDDNEIGNLYVRGHGYGDPLRECRHTYWGDTENHGYIFYPDGKLIAAAFQALSVYFDDMIEEKSHD